MLCFPEVVGVNHFITAANESKVIEEILSILQIWNGVITITQFHSP